jgi:pyruvate kinase
MAGQSPGRRTRIVATLGPASDAEPVLSRLLHAGVDVVRLNFSHGDHAEHGATIDRVRAAETRIGRPICVLQDLGGPKIRLGAIEGGGIAIHRGMRLTIDPDRRVGAGDVIGVSWSDLASVARAGARLLLDDGRVELRVESVDGRLLRCRVARGERLGAHKGVNLPGVDLPLPCMTAKDLDDLAFGVERGVDAVALSFVRRPEDVADARARIRQLGGDQPVIAKLERAEAVRQMAAIVRQADGIMVARGDLAVETSPEAVPAIQKRAIALATATGKPVITATQMLESMVDSTRPTRAEASDVANAILDGTDAVMLSEESAAGHHPVEAVRTMHRIALAIERSGVARAPLPALEEVGEVPRAVARAACTLADDLGAARLVVFTRSGAGARHVSKCRPRTPILAATPLVGTARRLQLLHGASTALVEAGSDPEALFGNLEATILANHHARPGDRVVLVFGLPMGTPGNTNAIRVHEVGSTR